MPTEFKVYPSCSLKLFFNKQVALENTFYMSLFIKYVLLKWVPEFNKHLLTLILVINKFKYNKVFKLLQTVMNSNLVLKNKGESLLENNINIWVI